ncbi:hypothetical protein FB451DRAFT_1241983, partial [Mycena latifolia]
SAARSAIVPTFFLSSTWCLSFFLSLASRLFTRRPCMHPSFLALLLTLALAVSTTASPLLPRADGTRTDGGRKVLGGQESVVLSTNPATAIANFINVQQSLTLDLSVVQKGFLNDGQNPPVQGQLPSLTSGNNFINFCARTFPETPLTNGQQIATGTSCPIFLFHAPQSPRTGTTGSCNAAPMGLIPSTARMPSAKFLNPRHFTNAQANYFSAPQQLNAQGTIIGHTHVVIEALPSLASTTATDPNAFFFFKGINSPLTNGSVSTPVEGGVPPGAYRLCSQNAAMNHQPVVVPVAQHGALDDCVY